MLGTEYHVSKPLDIRLGLLYDPSPIPTDYLTAMVPDSSKIGISAGIGYKFKNLFIDIAYLVIFARERLGCSKSWYIPDMQLHATRGSVFSVSMGIKF
jgi:long-subunit fatty acid transport protein